MVSQPISVALGQTGMPKREPSGVVALNRFGVWTPICVQNWSLSHSDEICSFNGYGYYFFKILLPFIYRII